MALPLWNETAHRPWPLPDRPWVARQDWIDLTFLHWRVAPEVMREHVPEPLELDLFAGSAWVGVVPFRMDRVRFRCTPLVPGLSSFPELNVRTYVKYRGKGGIFFLSLDVASRLMSWVGRRFFHLPYRLARMDHARIGNGWSYRSARCSEDSGRFVFEAEETDRGAPYFASSGTTEHFLTERYCFFAVTRAHGVIRGDVHHTPWPLRSATVTIEENTMLDFLGISPKQPPQLVHASSGVQVVGWKPCGARRGRGLLDPQGSAGGN